MAARRKGRGGSTPAGADLGVGALAAAELDHGERAVVEDTAAPAAPAGGAAAGAAPAGAQRQARPAPRPGQGVDPWAPTKRPGEPITAGLTMGAGPSGTILADDPDMMLRALYDVHPHDDIKRMLDAREF